MSVCLLALTALVLAQESAEPVDKPSPVTILDRTFPFGDRYRPGRWFPLEIVLQADKDWDGILWVQLDSDGPIFEKQLKMIQGERRSVPLAVLPGARIEGVAAEASGSRAKFSGPIPSESLRILLVGPESETASMRAALGAFPHLVGFEREIAEAVSTDESKLPDDLYSLDAFDLLYLHERAVRALPVEKKELLLRWAIVRGRVLTSVEGRNAMQLAPGQEAWVEAPGEPGAAQPARRFPIRHQAPDRLLPLQAKHFAKAVDPAFWVLVVFGAGFLWLSLRRVTGIWSPHALLAGGCSALLLIPGIGWPARTPVWRCIVLEEGLPGVAIEDRADGKSLPLTLSPREHLLVPKATNQFLVEWGPGTEEARFFLLDGERRLFYAAFLEGRQIWRGAGDSLRNGFAPLESVACLFPEQPRVRVFPEWNAGETLPFEAPSMDDPGEIARLPRPLRDFLGASWVSGSWLFGRIRSQDPGPSRSPFGSAPAASYLLWFPRFRD